MPVALPRRRHWQAPPYQESDDLATDKRMRMVLMVFFTLAFWAAVAVGLCGALLSLCRQSPQSVILRPSGMAKTQRSSQSPLCSLSTL